MKKSPKKQIIKEVDPKACPQGNRTPAPVDYQDPTGSKGEMGTPKNSGYDEKQPDSIKSVKR